MTSAINTITGVSKISEGDKNKLIRRTFKKRVMVYSMLVPFVKANTTTSQKITKANIVTIVKTIAFLFVKPKLSINR